MPIKVKISLSRIVSILGKRHAHKLFPVSSSLAKGGEVSDFAEATLYFFIVRQPMAGRIQGIT